MVDLIGEIATAGLMVAVVCFTAMGIGAAVGLVEEWRLRRDEAREQKGQSRKLF